MWKRIAVLIVVTMVVIGTVLPITATANTKLFYRKSYGSDYWKVEISAEAIDTPTAEPTTEPEPTVDSTVAPTPTVEVNSPTKITTPNDIITDAPS